MAKFDPVRPQFPGQDPPCKCARRGAVGTRPPPATVTWCLTVRDKFNRTYLLEFILAEKGLVEMFSSMGRFTDGMGLFEMPLSYRRAFNALFLDQSGTKLFRSICTQGKHGQSYRKCSLAAPLTPHGARESRIFASKRAEI